MSTTLRPISPTVLAGLGVGSGAALGCDEPAEGNGALANIGGGGSAATNGGGDAGAGGSLAPLVVFRPTTISDADADAAYDAWKTGFLEDCTQRALPREMVGDGTLTVSEGIGFGMLLTVVHDEQPIFDGLWQYYQNNLDSHGLMHWRRSGCEGAQSGDNAAADADLDAAMALVMASRRWSTTPYLADAQDLIEKIRVYETANGGNGLSCAQAGRRIRWGDLSQLLLLRSRLLPGVRGGRPRAGCVLEQARRRQLHADRRRREPNHRFGPELVRSEWRDQPHRTLRAARGTRTPTSTGRTRLAPPGALPPITRGGASRRPRPGSGR